MKSQRYEKVGVLRMERTEHAKAVRRQYGDNSGMCRFHDKLLRPVFDGCANTITGVAKDNILYIEI